MNDVFGVFAAHANVGFFHGADLEDPAGLLQGSGRRMRHVKVRPGVDVDASALEAMIRAAYADITRRLAGVQRASPRAKTGAGLRFPLAEPVPARLVERIVRELAGAARTRSVRTATAARRQAGSLRRARR